MKTEQKNLMPMLAGAAFLLLAISCLRGLIERSGYYHVLVLNGLFEMVCCAGLGALLLMKKRSMLLSIPVGVIAILRIFTFFRAAINWGGYGFFGMAIVLSCILDVLAAISLFLLVAVLLIDNLSQNQEIRRQFSFLPKAISTLSPYKEKAKQLWFIPLCLMAAASFFGLFRGGALSNIFTNLIFIAAYALLSMWLAYPDGFPAASGKTGGTAQVIDNAYCDLLKHILLLLFTFGIYHLIWIYRTTALLNCVEDEPPRNPTNKMLLCLFVPFYLVYWVYVSAQRLDRLAAAKGVSSDLTALCLILAIFIGIIPPILMQEKINTIAGGKTEMPKAQYTPAAPQPQHAAPQPQYAAPQPYLGIAEELKTYKELLDTGVITPEEFALKKKQLLGL